MLARSPEQQHRLGYFHTLREICQQPSTWLRTGELMRQSAPALSPLVEGISGLTISGSGSSDYAGDCVRVVLQKDSASIPKPSRVAPCSRTAALPFLSADPD
jgi:fructoselysine-6-P-deglycase FrlB-like protein